MQTQVMGADIKESETVKRLFLDTNPILLAVTIIVSILHSVLDFLAFKNDVSFWRLGGLLTFNLETRKIQRVYQSDQYY